jgi:hypothetical protein
VLWRKDWKTLSDEEWKDVIDSRCGGRRRLKKFLIENRDTASNFVQEMLDAREILTKETDLTVGNISQASILRAEYFDDVPETAEFLRPQNPDSLFQDRARLIWNEQRRRIGVQLPSVEQNKLPAIWRIGEHSQAATNSPDELSLNSEAFRNSLLLSLESGVRNEVQRLRGLTSWGLFDLVSGGRLINADRDDPSILWGLYRRMYHRMRGATLPLIEVINKRGEIPYLRMIWPLPLRGEIEQHLKRDRVVLGAILWTH